MIQIEPAWLGKRREEIIALYDYLLYQVLPFPPEAYLPLENGKPYYYDEGDLKTKKVVEEAKVSWTLSSAADRFLANNGATLTLLQARNNKIPNPVDLKSAIGFASADLYNRLYPNGELSREGLLELLHFVPVENNLIATPIALRSDFYSEENGKKLCSRKFLQGVQNLLLDIFNYEKISKQELFPKLIQLLNVNVCPYCNRSFTSTVQKQDGKFHRQNQVDHYLPKSRYPWFALSMPNWIPSCGNCNQKKGDGEELVLYPYTEGFGQAYRFRTRPLTGLGYLIGQPENQEEFHVVIEAVPGLTCPADYHRRVQNSIDKFGLDALYQESHNDYVSSIFLQRYIFNDAYIQSIMASFDGLFSSAAEVRNMLYLKNPQEEASAPLTKLTGDIDEEISRLKKTT